MIDLNNFEQHINNKRRSTSKVVLLPDNIMYFNKATREKYSINETVYVQIYKDRSSAFGNTIALVVTNEIDKTAIRFSKVGYLNTKNFFYDNGVEANKNRAKRNYSIREESTGDHKVFILELQSAENSESTNEQDEISEQNEIDSSIENEPKSTVSSNKVVNKGLAGMTEQRGTQEQGLPTTLSNTQFESTVGSENMPFGGQDLSKIRLNE